MPHARCSARARRMCRWCSHDSGNLGESNTCTLLSAAVPLNSAGLEKMCFGDIIHRAEQSAENVDAAMSDSTLSDCGGRPGTTRERVAHAQEIARHRQLLRDARAEHDPFRQKKAYDEAALFRKYRTLYVVPGIHGVCKAREHVKQHTFEPARCSKCRAWGVKSALQSNGTFGKQCCNHGKVDATHLPRNELDALLMLGRAEFQAQHPMKLRIAEMLLGHGCPNRSRYSPAVLRVVRDRPRDVNNELAFTSWSFRRSKKWAAANPGKDRSQLHDGIDGYRYETRICGRVHHFFGSVGSDPNHVMRNAGYYVHDTEAAGQERENKLQGRIGKGLTTRQAENLKIGLDLLDEALRQVNPFARDFQTARMRQFVQQHRHMHLPAHTLYINPHRRPTQNESINSSRHPTCEAAGTNSARAQRQRRRNDRLRSGTYNAPTSGEIAALLPDQLLPKHAIVVRNTGGPQNVWFLHRSLEPLHFVLLHPFGGAGYSTQLTCARNKKLNLKKYLAYRCQWRDQHANTTMRFGRLSQEYFVDGAVRLETERLNWIRNHQKTLRTHKYSAFQAAHEADPHGQVGKPVILPSSFSGGARQKRNAYHKSMALLRVYGMATYFITMTCNVEHARKLYSAALSGTKGIEHDASTQFIGPIPVEFYVMAFKEQKEQLLRDLKAGALGEHIANCWAIEFQKRGLPHLHLLLWIKGGRNAVDADAMVAG